jgi:D-3-phosphoglycerate dehydrogenase
MGQRFKLLAAGDRFVPAALLAERVVAQGTELGIEFEVRQIDLPFPSEPTIPLPATDGSGAIRAFWEDLDVIAARLAEDASDPTIREYTGPVDGLAGEVGDAEVLLLHTAPVSLATIAAAASLRAVGTVRTGPVNVNVGELSARGIPLFHCPGRNAVAVAEFITGALICHVRGIATASDGLRRGRWSLEPWSIEHAGIELAGKTCGLVGFGQVGRAFAPIARGLGMTLLVSDPFVDPATVEVAGGSAVALEDLLSRSDVVILVARLTAENRHLIDGPALARMKPSALLVNTARSQLVDTDALRAAVQQGAIAGAVIDVFDQEPPAASSELLSLPNTLLTPHIAGATRDTVHRGAEILARAVTGFLADGTLANCLNADAVTSQADGQSAVPRLPSVQGDVH